MTDETQVSDSVAQGQDASQTAAPVSDQTNSQQDATAAETPPVTEESIPKSHVSKLIAREKKEAVEKTKAALQADYAAKLQAQQMQQENQGSAGGINQAPSQEQLQRMIHETAYRMSIQETANRIANDFESKIDAEKISDPDFGELYDALNIKANPHLVPVLNGLDNTAKVVKDLAKNPSKFATVLMLANSGTPELAKRAIEELSQSLKANQEAAKQKIPTNPVVPTKPSNIGHDNDSVSVSDLQAKLLARR